MRAVRVSPGNGSLLRRQLVRVLLNHVCPDRRGRFWLEIVQRADIGDKLPDLVFGDAGAPGGHAVRPALDDGIEEIRRLISVDPLVLNERRSHASAAVSVAAAAVIP